MNPYYDHAGITLFCCDCREVLPTLVGDVVITDPPYGTGGWRRLQAGQGRNPRSRFVKEIWDDGAVDWLVPIPTLTFWPSCSAVRLLSAALAIGLTKHLALYMHKLDPRPQFAGRVALSVEPIWCLLPEGFQLHGGTDWISASTPRSGRDSDATGHPYQKPLSVLRWLVMKTIATTIIDPFAGSGTTLLAAKLEGRKAIGVEIEERYCEIAAKRLEQEVLPFSEPEIEKPVQFALSV